MKIRIRSRWLTSLGGTLLVLGAWGCAGYPPQISRTTPTQVEERYRIFFSRQVPTEARVTDAPEELAREFVPEQAVTSAIEDFKRQNFTLAEIERIPWGEGATLFVFQRNVIGEPPLRSPLNFIGTYRVEDNDAEPTYYIFNQTIDGYSVQVLSRGEVAHTYDAKWEGRELVWQSSEGKNNARLTPDGRVLYRIIESATGFNVPRDRTIVKAHRVTPLQKPDSPEVRDARRYVIRLAPQTPRYYDPYPWTSSTD